MKNFKNLKGVQSLTKEELCNISGGDFPWKALKEIYDWVVDKLKPQHPRYQNKKSLIRRLFQFNWMKK